MSGRSLFFPRSSIYPGEKPKISCFQAENVTAGTANSADYVRSQNGKKARWPCLICGTRGSRPSKLVSPGVVRRAASKPISIIRSTSVPAQLQDRTQPGDSEAGGGSGGKTTGRRGLHFRDRSLQHDFKSGGAGGFGGIVQSLPPPQAPLLAGSLPPSRFLDDLPPLCLGPQVCGPRERQCMREVACFHSIERERWAYV